MADSRRCNSTYHTAPIGLVFCRRTAGYLHINQRLTEHVELRRGAFGTTVANRARIGRFVEEIVRLDHGDRRTVTGIEVTGECADETEERSWVTYRHPSRSPSGEIVGVNVAAEEVTERSARRRHWKQANASFQYVGGSIPQLVWMAEPGQYLLVNNHRRTYTGAPMDRPAPRTGWKPWHRRRATKPAQRRRQALGNRRGP